MRSGQRCVGLCICAPRASMRRCLCLCVCVPLPLLCPPEGNGVHTHTPVVARVVRLYCIRRTLRSEHFLRTCCVGCILKQHKPVSDDVTTTTTTTTATTTMLKACCRHVSIKPKVVSRGRVDGVRVMACA